MSNLFGGGGGYDANDAAADQAAAEKKAAESKKLAEEAAAKKLAEDKAAAAEAAATAGAQTARGGKIANILGGARSGDEAAAAYTDVRRKVLMGE